MGSKIKLSAIYKKIVEGHFQYLFEMKLVSGLNKFLKLRPSSHPYVSGDSFRHLADVRIDDENFYVQIDDGDVVFISADRLINFYKIRLSKLDKKIILITHDSDILIDEGYRFIAECDSVYKWYAQNATLSHHKVTTIPIGLEDAWRHNHGVVSDITKNINTHAKNPRILYGFNEATNPQKRQKAGQILRKCPLVDRVWTNSRRYKKILSKYMFVVSPEGNGIDCHRTWEALYLGVIPIVTSSFYDNMFKDFPCLKLPDWSEINSINELRLLEEYNLNSKKIKKIDYLWMDYWEKDIENTKIHLLDLYFDTKDIKN